VDWDQDGKLDILSGCYWTEGASAGQIQFLQGNGGLDFAESVALENSAGQPLENVEITDENQGEQTSSICTHQHAVDYDGDGDLDLVVGCFESNFYLYENRADDESGENLLAEPFELSIKSPNYHAAPHLVDWDNDGDLDLLSGAGDGGVLYSENIGTRTVPQWSSFKQLVAYSNQQQQSTDDGSEIQMSPATRVWAHDVNGDGLLDLLIGDSANIVNAAKGVSAEEAKRLKAENKKALAEASKKQFPLTEEYSKLMERGEEPSAELLEEMKAANMEYMEIYNARSEYEDSQRTGFVWLMIRKPDLTPVSTSPTNNP